MIIDTKETCVEKRLNYMFKILATIQDIKDTCVEKRLNYMFKILATIQKAMTNIGEGSIRFLNNLMNLHIDIAYDIRTNSRNCEEIGYMLN